MIARSLKNPFLCRKFSNEMKQKFCALILLFFQAITQPIKWSSFTTTDITPNDTLIDSNIKEVIITSSVKETNNLRSLPAAVSLLTPQTINTNQIQAIKDISSYVPNLYIPDYGSKLTSAIYIRGIGARSSGQSVGLYVDNVPYLDKSTFDFEFTDIQRIEVLRGPQGTLYGRNAMGGIINIYTISPFDFQGKKILLSGGNYGQFSVKASHYGMLNEKIGFTAAAYYDHSNGFFTNTYNNEKADKEDAVGGRIKLEARFSPNLKAFYSVSTEYVNQGAFPYGLYNQQDGTISPVCINDSSSYRRFMIANNFSLEYNTTHFTLSSTTGYQFFNDNMKMDQDFTSASVFTLNQQQKQHAISQEINLKSNASGNYHWAIGAFGFYNTLNTEGPVTFKEDGIKLLQQTFDDLKEENPRMPALTITDKSLYIPGSFKTPAFGLALYHQSTYNNLFIDGLSVTAGLRLDYEKQKLQYASDAKMHLSMTIGNRPPMDISNMYDRSVIQEKTSQDFWQLLPKIAIKYECTPGTTTYLSVAKGYKTGGYNVQMSADLMQAQMQYDMMSQFSSMIPIEISKPSPMQETASYKPEQSWNYEAGFRSELFDSRLFMDFAFFYMNIRDLQLTQFVNSGNGRILTNAGKADSYGAEASVKLQITNELSANANYGYTHATFRNYNDGKNNYKGNFIPYTPRHTLNIGIQYNKRLSNCWIDQVFASAQLNGYGPIYWNEANDIRQDFYATLKAKAGVRKGRFNLSVWSKNITNCSYTTFYFESFGNSFMQQGKPFQIGAEISFSI